VTRGRGVNCYLKSHDVIYEGPVIFEGKCFTAAGMLIKHVTLWSDVVSCGLVVVCLCPFVVISHTAASTNGIYLTLIEHNCTQTLMLSFVHTDGKIRH